MGKAKRRVQASKRERSILTGKHGFKSREDFPMAGLSRARYNRNEFRADAQNGKW
jgi:hypothetical protein